MSYQIELTIFDVFFLVLDANPKFNSGVFNGNIRMFGDFEQCLSIHNNKINGKFCSIWFEPKKVFSQRSFNLAKMVK